MKTVYTTERSDGGVDIVVQHRGRSIFWSLVFLACALYSVVDWSTLGGMERTARLPFAQPRSAGR